MAELLFETKTPDGLVLKGRHWPVENPNAVILLVHGYGEHVGRYEHVAAFFNRKKIAVAGLDRRGHGISDGPRGHTPSYTYWTDEIKTAVAQMKSEYPDAPIILYGQSQGGHLILRAVLDELVKDVAGAIVSSPWVDLAFQPSWFMLTLGKISRKLAPALSQPNGLNAAHLSHDKNVVEAYVNDPLVHKKVTSEAGMSMMDGCQWLQNYRGETAVPLLIMQGDEDKITNFAATRKLAAEIHGDVTFKPWPGKYHELHNETNKEQVLDFVWEWLVSKGFW